MKKITITLSDKTEKYFNEVGYSLDTEDGSLATQSEIINHCLEELAVFEDIVGKSLTDYCEEHLIKTDYEKDQDRFKVKDDE